MIAFCGLLRPRVPLNATGAEGNVVLQITKIDCDKLINTLIVTKRLLHMFFQYIGLSWLWLISMQNFVLQSEADSGTC